MGTEDVVYTTGYQSNLGCISAILEPRDTVICDSGDHASILDGCKLSGARLRPFRHNRMDKLETMLERAAADQSGTFVVVDGVLDGGRRLRPAPIVELCRRFGARLMVDEAHGVGVLGKRGAGACELFGPRSRSICGWGPFEEPRLLRRFHRRRRGGDRVPEDRPRLHLQRLGGPGGRGRCARRPADHPLRGTEPMSRLLGTPPTYARGSATSVFGWWSPGPPGRPEATTPVVPVIVGEDWQAVLL